MARRRVFKKPKRMSQVLKQHVAKCGLCSFIDCGEVESAFLEGYSVRDIQKRWADEFEDLSISQMTIYRHINAFNLRKYRDNSIAARLERIIDSFDNSTAIKQEVYMKALELVGRMKGEIVDKVKVDVEGELTLRQAANKAAKRRVTNLEERLQGNAAKLETVEEPEAKGN